MIFAAGGLGIGAAVNAILCFGLLSLVLAAFLCLVGVNFARSTNKNTKRLGVIIVLLSCSLPFLYCLSLRDITGRSELRMKIREGMTQEEVIAAVGEPSSKQKDSWIYHCDLWGLNIFGVHFREDGRVEWTFVND
jgi:hypothetical protein